MSPAPFVFTFSICGSMKTLDFLRWLGADVPKWIENDLKHAGDTLEALLSTSPDDGLRADDVLPHPRQAVRNQRGKRLDQASGNRSVGATCTTASSATQELSSVSALPAAG